MGNTNSKTGMLTQNMELTKEYVTHEIQVSEGGEADLHQHAIGCKKNPGHPQFVSVNDFNINHLPERCHDNDLVKFIKCTADLTARVAVKMISTERPQFLPNSNQPYPFYDKRGTNIMRLGTGMVTNASKWTEKSMKIFNLGTCPCHKCKDSDTPSKEWGKVVVFTARHVVFDEHEARQATCRFFYDRQQSPLVTLDGWTVDEANTEEDWCVLKCWTCDIGLINKLHSIRSGWVNLQMDVNNRYKPSRDKEKLTMIVSHPHGCPKQISVGRWIDRHESSDERTKYTYTTCTCPGSSGAYIYSLGYFDGPFRHELHVHSGVNPQGFNCSGTGQDWIQYLKSF